MWFRLDQIPVLYEDADILVLNKPAGISVIPERYEDGDLSLLELLTKRVEEKETSPSEGLSIRPVHRIDKDTSGIVLFAKTDEAFRTLSLQFQERTLSKIYHAIVRGRPLWSEQECAEPLLVDGDRRHRTIVHRDGKPSRTRFRVLEPFRGFALLEAQPETGRTHQIRAHLSWIGHPIVGDALYRGGEGLYLSSFKSGYKGVTSGSTSMESFSADEEGDGERWMSSKSAGRPGRSHTSTGTSGEKPLIGRMALHAFALEFRHPRTGETLRFESPYPKDFSVALKQLRKYGT